MCGGGPKPPKPQPNYALIEQSKSVRDAEIRARHEQKRARTEDMIGKYGNRFGRASLFSGGQGGIGFSATGVRSLFEPGR